ncbi:MAG: methyltransferase regulatory domain-containing protein, partial [Proteobacteria bacterium]|nr:methyltransferase regulatory domain-containing protein [Pseudomonadota bacterium]
DAIQFTDKLLATAPLFLKANPSVAQRIERMKGQDRHYLAHEYFNRDWDPMHFFTMVRWLESARLDYACSADLQQGVNSVNLTEPQQQFLAEIPDLMLRQSVWDFMANNQFRRDYWIKGLRRMSPMERTGALNSQRLLLSSFHSDIELKVNCVLGEATLSEEIYSPVIDALSEQKIKTIEQLHHSLTAKGIQYNQLIEAVLILVNIGHIALVQSEEAAKKARPSTAALNKHLLSMARGASEITNLVSPVTGGGVAVSLFQQLFILALNEGKKEPEEWVQYAWQVLQLQDRKIVKKGLTLEAPEENLTELRAEANAFAEKRVKFLKSAGVV